MTTLLLVHVLAVGIWIGCVGVELVAELLCKNQPPETSYIALLHWRIDQFVEIPALLVVLTTGILLWPVAPLPLILLVKIGFGISAIILNLICAFLIRSRYKCQQNKNMLAYDKAEKLHSFFGIGVVISLVSAVSLGGIYIGA